MKFINDIKNFGEIINEDIQDLNNSNSFIINYKEFQVIKGWINQNKKIKVELLYRLSRDGDQISKFHELCDNKGPTLTLFLSEDGNKGGIFTTLSWDKTSREKIDSESFMFNLNKNEKYKKKQ